MFSPNARIRGITLSMSVTDVAAELLNSPPRIGQGSDDNLSAAKPLCTAKSAISEIISLLIVTLLSDVEQAVEACKTQNLEHFAVYVGKYQAPPAGGALLLKL